MTHGHRDRGEGRGMKIAGAMITGLAFGLLCAAIVLVLPWLLMLLLGGLHHEVSPLVPALGFDQTILVSATVAVVGAIFGAPSWGRSSK